jgi:hypothetical protein
MSVTDNDCPRCGAPADEADYKERRKLPQVGQTWTCQACGGEVTRYITGNDPATHADPKRILQPVTTEMARYLSAFELASARPDDLVEDLVTMGATRVAAVDYHMVEREDISQSEWARRTNRNQSTVSGNIRSVAELLLDRAE